MRVIHGTRVTSFGVRYSAKEGKSNFHSLREFINRTQWSLFVAIGFALLLQYLDPSLYIYYQKVNFKIPDDGDYVTLLATISGIGGVFIGLYYAGITGVGSAIYASVPNNVRDLLTQDRSGNVYMRFLSFLTFLGLALIALRISGQPRIFLAIPFMTIAAGVGIISFVNDFGRRTFYLFDPTSLSNHIFEQLQHWVGMIKADGYQWLDKPFQKHAYRQASTNLDTLETLAEITSKGLHLNGKPFIELSKNLLRFLRYYEYAKRSIPTDSAWYEPRYQHHDWYRADDTRVSIAHQTGTTLQPVVTNDKEWIEDRITPIVIRCIEINLTEARYAEVIGLFGYIDAYLKRLTLEGGVTKAFALIEVLTSAVLGKIAIEADGDTAKPEVLEKLAIVEWLALIPVTMALGYREALEKLDRNDIENRMSSVRWNKESSIYSLGFNAYTLEQLEGLKPRLLFEKMVENNVVTPLWYQVELLCKVEAAQLEENTSALVLKGADFYRASIAKALSQNHPWLAAAAMSREWEYWHKVEDQLELWQSKWANLSDDRRIVGLSWSEFDIEALRKNSSQRQEELLKLMSKQSTLLALNSRPDGFPDFAGQFLHTSGEVVFEALLNNNVELLKSVFASYFLGCLMQFDSHRSKIKSVVDWQLQQEFKIAAAVLLDVMCVSGYARLLADYHGNESLWSDVSSVWDGYFASKVEQSPMPLFCAAVTLTEGAFEIAHRSILRTSWEQEINHKLRDVPRHEVSYRGSFSSDTVIDHDSALVRIFAQDLHGSFNDGIDIFIVTYLSKLEGGKEMDFGWQMKGLQESIERESQKMPVGDSNGADQ